MSRTYRYPVARVFKTLQGEGHFVGYPAVFIRLAGNQPLKVPGAFAIAIPVFRGDVPIQIGVRLRYRIERGSVLWFFSPQRLDAVFDHQVLESCELAKGNTLLPLYFGRPEQ